MNPLLAVFSPIQSHKDTRDPSSSKFERRLHRSVAVPSADSLSALEKRDWKLWAIAALLLTVFAGGLLVYLYHDMTEHRLLSPTTVRYSWFVVYGFIALIVLLNVHLTQKKRALVALWRHYLTQQQELEKERRKAVLDPVAQVYNRRFFDEIIPKQTKRCDRTEQPLTFLLIGLDDFKKIRQQLGDFAGDDLLRAVAGVVREALRTSDYVFRLGGDDLLVALPETSPEGAAVVTGRLRQKLAARADLEQHIRRPLRVTIGHSQQLVLARWQAAGKPRIREFAPWHRARAG